MSLNRTIVGTALSTREGERAAFSGLAEMGAVNCGKVQTNKRAPHQVSATRKFFEARCDGNIQLPAHNNRNRRNHSKKNGLQRRSTKQGRSIHVCSDTVYLGRNRDPTSDLSFVFFQISVYSGECSLARMYIP